MTDSFGERKDRLSTWWWLFLWVFREAHLSDLVSYLTPTWRQVPAGCEGEGPVNVQSAIKLKLCVTCPPPLNR